MRTRGHNQSREVTCRELLSPLISASSLEETPVTCHLFSLLTLTSRGLNQLFYCLDHRDM